MPAVTAGPAVTVRCVVGDIDMRQLRSCQSQGGRRCNGTPAYQAHVFDLLGPHQHGAA